MAALASFANTDGATNVLIGDVLKQTEKNTAGLYAVRFFIRGKPWILTIDDFVSQNSADNSILFAQTTFTAIDPTIAYDLTL